MARQSQGFVYYVSLTGITGAKLPNLADVSKNVEKIRKVTRVPVAVGFGVATPEDAAKVAAIADGVIVGSAIVKLIAAHGQKPEMVKHVAEFVRSLKTAMRAAQPKHARHADPHLSSLKARQTCCSNLTRVGLFKPH